MDHQQQVDAWFAAVRGRLAGLGDQIDRANYEAWCARFGIEPVEDNRTDWYRQGEFGYANDPEMFYITRQWINVARANAVRAEAEAAPRPVPTPRPTGGSCWECGRVGTWNDAEQWYACAEHWEG